MSRHRRPVAGFELSRVHLVSNTVNDKEQAALLRGCRGVIFIRACGGIIAGCQCMVFENHIPLHHIAVLEALMMMRRIMGTGQHPDQRGTFSANRIFVKPRYRHAGKTRSLPIHPLAADQSHQTAGKHGFGEDTMTETGGRGGSGNCPGKLDCHLC
jgi:hypothetical protein